jgi:hypothetical protein
MPKVFLNKAPLKESEEYPGKEFPEYTVNVGIIKVINNTSLSELLENDDDATTTNTHTNREENHLEKTYSANIWACTNQLLNVLYLNL